MLFNIFKKRRRVKTLLTVSLDASEIALIYNVPVEERHAIKLESQHPILTFTDSDGRRYSHDLTSVKNEGFSWLHLSVRVHDTYTCQADCLISNSSEGDAAAFQKGEIKGIRFQPFYLPGCDQNPDKLIGQGVSFRGFHFPGIITPDNVSSSCICDFCSKSFRLQSLHTVFAKKAYFYCDNGPHTLILSQNIKGTPIPLTRPDAYDLAELESHLPNCKQCNGIFKYSNSLLCPHCSKPFIDFKKHPDLRDSEYYGNYLYGIEFQEWYSTNSIIQTDTCTHPADTHSKQPEACNTCHSDRKRIWGPRKGFPDISDVWVGNYIEIKVCPECKTLWVSSPFEPYSAFPYMVIWDYMVDDFKLIHLIDNGKLIFEWLKSEIRVQIKTGDDADKKAYEFHNARSYGMFEFNRYDDENTVDILPFIKSVQ